MKSRAVIVATLIAGALVCGVARAADARAELAAQCNRLIQNAVKRPYGWGWGDEAEVEKAGRPNAIAVSLEPGATATAGLVLFMASEFLHEPKYAEAARNVGRGLAAAQLPSGKFADTVYFNASAVSSKEAATPLPDRGSTRAAMALLLLLADNTDQQQEGVNRAASRAAHWLVKQQVESGAWPIFYPPGSTPQTGTRIVRLDTRDTRDCVLAVLLASEVLGEASQRRSTERSVEFLLKCRTAAGPVAHGGLWQSAYMPTGVPYEHGTDFPPRFDTLASRFSIQAIFSSWMVLGDGPRLTACEGAAKAIEELIAGTEGQWHRRFTFKGESADPVATEPAKNTFGPPEGTAKDVAPMPPDAKLKPTTEAVALARKLGREKFRERLSLAFTPKQHFALTISGLHDAPLTPDLPEKTEALETWLKSRGAEEAATTTAFAAKVRGAWVSYLRARVTSP